MSQNHYITDIRPADVLFGRGSGANDHEGNIRFRQIVAERKDEYLSTNNRNAKTKIAKEIVNQVLIANGRFLKRLEREDLMSLNLPLDIEAFTEADESTIMEKAKQALRQNNAKRLSDKSSDSSYLQSQEANFKQDLSENSYAQRQRMPPPQLDPHRMSNVMSTVDLEPYHVETSDSRISDSSLPFMPSPQNSNGMPTIMQGQPQHFQQIPGQVQSMNRHPQEETMMGHLQQRMVRNEEFITSSAIPPARNNSMDMTDIFANRSRLRSSQGMELSVDMMDLMESFDSKTKLAGVDDSKRMEASSDTMGTIEGMASQMNMSDAYVSSDFSFPTNESSAKNTTDSESLPKDDTSPNHANAYASGANKTSLASGQQQPVQNVNQNDTRYNRPAPPAQLASTMTHTNGLLPEEPAPGGLEYGGSSMGASSLSMLKSMLMSKSEFDEQQEQYK